VFDARDLYRCSVKSFSDDQQEDAEERTEEPEGALVEESTDASLGCTQRYSLRMGMECQHLDSSANATAAAFERNVEFLVQLSGKKSLVASTRFFERRQPAGFGTFLQSFELKRPRRQVRRQVSRTALAREQRAVASAELKLVVERAASAPVGMLRCGLGWSAVQIVRRLYLGRLAGDV